LSARRALVTGAAGFVGANLVRRLLRDGWEVEPVVSPASEAWRLEGLAVAPRRADLREPEALAGAGADVVFHLAAHGAYSWETDTDRIHATNVEGTRGLLAAVGDAVVVHAGSSSEYGRKDHAPAEDEPAEPDSDYARAKLAATELVHEHGGVTLRLYSAYGPWEEPNRLVPTLVGHALRGELPPLVAPDTARDFVYVEDVCDAFVRAVDAPRGAVLNVASGRQTTLREIVAMVREQLGVEVEPDWGTMDNRSWDTSTWVGDATRARELLGWEATTPLADGLRATAGWLRGEGAATGRYAGGG